MINFDVIRHDEAVVLASAPLHIHSHFRTGGKAGLLVIPQSERAVVAIARQCIEANIPLYVVGQLSNVLVSDEGLDGVVMLLGHAFSKAYVEHSTITAEAGIWLSRLSAIAARHYLSGLEFACGIPGTLGASILINAGAYDGQFADIVKETRYLDAKGEIHVCHGDEHRFGYRQSRFIADRSLILTSKMILGEPEENMYHKMAVLAKKRRDSQPLSSLSCGSAFKRPEGYFAGKLISDAGLKGYTGNNAGVSAKHAGFIVNHGDASSADIVDVFNHVQDTVLERFGVLLEPEVRFAGHFDRIPAHAHTLDPLFGG